MSIQLEVGKSYRARNGEIVKIISDDAHDTFPFNGNNGISYTPKGTEWKSKRSENDLLSLFEDVIPEKHNESDPVNSPAHYTSHPSGIECIQVTEHMGFNLGNAIKYLWRADLKADAIEDMKKAVWYIQREISKRESGK